MEGRSEKSAGSDPVTEKKKEAGPKNGGAAKTVATAQVTAIAQRPGGTIQASCDARLFDKRQGVNGTGRHAMGRPARTVPAGRANCFARGSQI